MDLKKVLIYSFVPLVMGYQMLSRADLKPPGEFIEINQSKMHFQKQGAGGPAVVFESGMSGWSVDWSLIQPQVSKLAQTLSYDRLGYGFSEETSEPRKIENIVDELHSLLQATGIKRKYILVGHSLGGLYVQYYARKYAKEVAGIVLVDAVTQSQSRSMPEEMRARYEGRLIRSTSLASTIAPLGLLRLLNQPSSIVLDKIPEDQRAFAETMAFQPKSYRMLAQEMANFQDSQTAMDQLKRWPSIPVTVISSGQIRDFPPGFKGDNMKMFWDEMQDILAAELHAKHLIAEQSGHYVHLDEPHLVVQAITEMVQKLRKKARR